MAPVRLQLLGVCVTCAFCMLCFAQGEESVVRAKVGGAAELGCSLAPPSLGVTAPPFNPLHVVEWVRRDFDVPVLIKFGPYAPRVHPSFERRVSLSRGAALLVQRVRLEDEGWYECRILRLNRTAAGSVNGTSIFLSVSAPPEFTKTPSPVIEVMQGNSLALTCNAHGNPQPTIIWTKDDMAIENGEETEVKDGTLTVSKVTRQMAGTYKCHVSNTEGRLTHATQLRVKGPPVILLPPKDTMLNMSQNAQLQCRAEANPPNMTYVWWRRGENVYHIDSLKSRVKILVDGTLLIPNLIPEDSGNYTCMPTNGLLTPPTASAYLAVKHPAQAVQMPQVTYLPAGMGGRIICPVRAEPPLLYVSWTKDGQVLDMNMFPGWMLMADGSLFMAAANEDAVGTYTCTPYNSYGTMGSSTPTQVVLQDPPSFSVHPHEEYEQEVGTTLVIPCHAHGNPSPSITWAKVGRAPRSPYTVAANGSLVLVALSKDHHGPWECVAANQVANLTASTRVSVLGTSPHAVSSVTADPGTNQVNVSWVPGFDGGFTQKFTVWMKQTLGQKPDWVSLPAPPSAPPMLVTGLLPGTDYHFSVLPHNKVGTGPFSDIAAVQTLVPLTDPPPAVTVVPELAPPTSLSANQSVIGIVLKWVPPPPQGPPLTGFILQSRREGEEEWNILKEDITANDSETLLQGLQKDCRYELRMLSLRDSLVSTPSQPINISTAGIGAFIVRPRHLEGGPEVHVGGVLAGVGILCAVLLLLLGTACLVNRGKRRRRCQKTRKGVSSALQKCPPDRSGTRPDSPDSVLKIKAGRLNTIFPKSSSSGGSCRGGPDQDRQLLCQPRPKDCLRGREKGEGADVSPAAPLQSISRGADGRFFVRPCQDSPACSHKEDFPECPGGGSVFSRWDCRGSLCSLCSDPDGIARVLSVELPDTGSGSCSDSDSCADPCGSTRLCTPVPADRAGTFPRWGGREGRASLLPQDRAWEMVDGRALVTQMEWERESGHLSRCLTLAQEREALERELEHCEARLSSRAWHSETARPIQPEERQQAANPKASDGTAHRDNPQLRGQDWSPPDPRGTCHLGAERAGPNVSAPSHTLRDSNPIISISGCIPIPHLDAWPQEEVGPYTSSSLPTNPESTCLLSDSMKTGTCYWRASSQGSVSKPTKEPQSGKGKKDEDCFTQSASDQSQRHLLQEGDEEGGRDNEGPSPGSTWPYRRGTGANKTRVVETLGISNGGSSTLSFPESEKEVTRAHLWNSGKYLTIGRCGKSPTNQIANDDSSSQPDVSVSQISGSVRPNLIPQPGEASQVHTDPILKYLSLPGFVEMNVDEPMNEDNTTAISSGPNSSHGSGDVFSSELKALPIAWPANTCEAGLTTQAGEPPTAGLSSREESCRCLAESKAAGLCRKTGSSQKQLPSPDRTLCRQVRRSQSLPRESRPGRGEQREPQNHLSDLNGLVDPHRPRPSLGSSVVQDLDRALTQATQDLGTQGSRIPLSPSVCDPVPSGHGQGLHRRDQGPHKPGQGSRGSHQEPHGRGQGPHGHGQRPHGRVQGPHERNQGPQRRGQGPRGCGQATTTNLTKTLIRRPCRTQVEVPPDPVVRKSASLRMQTREHRASAESTTSQAGIGGGFPSPEVWVRSLSLGSTSKSRLDPLRGTQHNSEEPPSRSSALTPSPPAPEQQRSSASPDPRRHATIFPEAPRSPLSYPEAPPHLQRNTATPPISTTPLYPSNSSSCAPDHPRPRLPRWSQPSHAPFTRREPNKDQGPKQESETGQCMEEVTSREEGRGSYASQSSGRGSLGPLSGPTPSPSPTLPSSPETIQEIKSGGRRRVSVDENYEWDTTIVYLESDSPKPNQDMGVMKGFPHPEDLNSKGDPLSLSPGVLKYQLSPGSTSSRTGDLDTVLF